MDGKHAPDRLAQRQDHSGRQTRSNDSTDTDTPAAPSPKMSFYAVVMVL